MMLCGILSMMWFVHLSTPLWLTTAEVPQSQQQAGGDRHVVRLHRQRVPVRNDDEVVSFKSVYFGTIHVGTPEVQTFTVVFDTGSGHLVLPSVACHTESCKVHTRYDHNLSQMGEAIHHNGVLVEPGDIREQITITFGTGEITGQFVRDLVCLSPTSEQSSSHQIEQLPDVAIDASEDSCCIHMGIVAATAMSHEPFAFFSFDGVLGLGLDSLALAPEFSFFDTLGSQASLDHNSFGVFLADSDDDFSEISFGGYNPERVSSELSWADVAMPELGFWQVQINAIRIGKRTLDFCADGQCRAVLDTGTSLIAVPGIFADELFDELEGSLQDPSPSTTSVTDCKNATGELLSFDLQGTTLVLGPRDYARTAVQMSEEDGELEELAAQAMLERQPRNVIDGSNTSEETKTRGPPQEAKCYPTLMPIDLPKPLGPKLFILGEPVLRKYYTVYDWGARRIGFGVALQKTNSEENENTDLGDVSVANGESKRQPLLTVI